VTPAILTLNAGSSSLKFGLFDAAGETVLITGGVDRIGGEGRLWLGDLAVPDDGDFTDHPAALTTALAALDLHFPELAIVGVGHRVVHGGPDLTAPAPITPQVLAQIGALAPFAPLHQPHNLSGIHAARMAFPQALHLACFDTAFHRGQPWENDTYALPRVYYAKGIRRYGFHGLNYEHVAAALLHLAPDVAQGRVIVAHLGNGASMCGLRGGRSVASTMGFTALDGLPMGTRAGQIDPGVLLYLMDQEGMGAAEIADLLYLQSGLLGLSGLSNDMRVLEASDTPEAAGAIAYFCARIRREAGSLAAALGGLDALVFTGGIGENSRRVRAQVCDGLGWLGVALTPHRNAANCTVLSPQGSAVRVLMIPANEEQVIARATAHALSDAAARPNCRTS